MLARVSLGKRTVEQSLPRRCSRERHLCLGTPSQKAELIQASSRVRPWPQDRGERPSRYALVNTLTNSGGQTGRSVGESRSSDKCACLVTIAEVLGQNVAKMIFAWHDQVVTKPEELATTPLKTLIAATRMLPDSLLGRLGQA